jgi:predicted permease
MNNNMLSRLRALTSRIRGLFTSHRLDDDFAQELDSHLALLTEENIRKGMPEAEAKRAARLKLGSEAALRESHHDQRTIRWLESVAQDVRFALRMLRKKPGFTAVAILTLALGIGVNTTLFSAYDAVALKPLPVADPAHVVRFERWFHSRTLGSLQYEFSYPEYLYCREHGDLFAGLVASSVEIPIPGSLEHSSVVQRFGGQIVSANYFEDFGIQMQLGRPFTDNEDLTPGGNPVVVLSYLFWQRAFQEDPRAVGQVLTLNGTAFTIIGVASREFSGTTLNGEVPAFWAPLSMQAELASGSNWLHSPDQYKLQIFARLKNSASRQAAQAQTELMIRQFASTYVAIDKTTTVTLQRTTYFPNTDDIRFRASVAAAMLIVGLILFVACVNVGNMLLASGSSRLREISTRRALGASRARVIRQLLAESVLLALFGGVAGLIISVWSTDLLRAFLQTKATPLGGASAYNSLMSAVNLTPDFRIMFYVLVLSLCAGTLLGLSPALHCTTQDLASALKSEGPSMGRLRGSRLRNILIAAQVAVSVFLLAVAGFLMRGLIRSQSASPGFETRDAFLLFRDFDGYGDGTPAALSDARLRLTRALEGQPEFAAVAMGTIPLSGSWSPLIATSHVSGQTLASYASDTYLNLFDIPLLKGRNFTQQESDHGADVAIISESTARSFWPNQDPIGQAFSLDMNFRGKLHTFQVIGIVKDVRFVSLSRIDPAHVYLPAGSADSFSPPSIFVRLHGDSRQALLAAQSVDGMLFKNSPSDTQLINIEDGFVAFQRTLSQVLAMFAVILACLALTLAGIGIYGVLSYLVSQRFREIGIRMALGASPIALLRSIVRVGLRPVMVGIVTGLATAAAFTALLHQTLVFPGSIDFFYGVRFYDPLTFAGLFCFALLTAVLASAIPANRAIRVEPVSALRCE